MNIKARFINLWGSVRSPFSRRSTPLRDFRRLIGFSQTPLNQALRGRYFGLSLEQVVEGDLAVDKIDGVFVGSKPIGGNHHGLDEDSFLDGITQNLHFISD